MTFTPAMAQAIELWPLDRLIPYANNARTHTEEQVALVAGSIREFGFTNPMLVDSRDGIIAGHCRLLAARKLGMAQVPVIVLDHLTDAQRRAYILLDNKLAELAGWDYELLAAERESLRDEGFDVGVIGFTDEDLAGLRDDDEQPGQGQGQGQGNGQGQEGESFEPRQGSLAERFGLAPFSVFNSRDDWWQGRRMGWGPFVGEEGKQGPDPVLCELLYRWFCPPGGTVLDPFAEGGVQEIVATVLGRQYGQGAADFIFSAPPHSDMDDPDSRRAFDEVVAATCARLKPDRFACFVVEERRGEAGNFSGVVRATVHAFQAAGLEFYNEAVMVTSGEGTMTAQRDFSVSRRLGKNHRNVLIFCKGDPRNATQAIGDVEFGEILQDQETAPLEGDEE